MIVGAYGELRSGGHYGAGRAYVFSGRDYSLLFQLVSPNQEAGAALTNRPEFAAFPDLSDQATAEVDSNFELRLKEREQKLLKKIDEALDRIATNTYGICERCGEEIPYKRLKARPVTTLCIECKTQQEEEEKIRA